MKIRDIRIHRDPSPQGQRRRARLGRVLVATMAVSALVMWGPMPGATSTAEQGPVDTYTVAAGDTMWSIASAITLPGHDVWDTVDTIAHMNGVQPSTIRAGQQLLVPSVAS